MQPFACCSNDWTCLKSPLAPTDLHTRYGDVAVTHMVLLQIYTAYKQISYLLAHKCVLNMTLMLYQKDNVFILSRIVLALYSVQPCNSTFVQIMSLYYYTGNFD